MRVAVRGCRIQRPCTKAAARLFGKRTSEVRQVSAQFRIFSQGSSANPHSTGDRRSSASAQSASRRYELRSEAWFSSSESRLIQNFQLAVGLRLHGAVSHPWAAFWGAASGVFEWYCPPATSSR